MFLFGWRSFVKNHWANLQTARTHKHFHCDNLIQKKVAIEVVVNVPDTQKNVKIKIYTIWIVMAKMANNTKIFESAALKCYTWHETPSNNTSSRLQSS